MSITCKNCNNVFEGNFCNNCGQSASVKRINWKYIYDDVKGNYVSFNKTKFYSAKELLFRPGFLIRDFLSGKRVNFYKPVSLVLFVASVYAYLFHTFNINPYSVSQSGIGDVNNYKFNIIHEWINSHFSISSLISVPIISVTSFLLFKKQNLNFSEYLVINTFLAAQRIIIRIVFFPVMLIMNYTHHLNYIFQFLSVADIALMVWAFYQMFENISLLNVILKVLLIYLISFILTLAGFVMVFLIL